MTKTALSVIVPVFRTEKYLPRCLDSIVAQTFTDWECILIDDGSPDASGKICDEYAAHDSRFRVIHQENKGVSAARNAGLDVAKGEWITFVDSDDWLDSEAFSSALDAAENYNADVLVFGYTLFDGISDFKEILPPNGGMDLSTDLDSEWQGPWSKLFRSTVLTTVRFPEGIAIGEDMFFTLQVYLETDKIFGLQKEYYHYFQNKDSSTHHISVSKIMQEKSVVQKIEALLKDKNRLEKWQGYLNMRKQTVKNRFLVSLEHPRCDLWRTVFPEINTFCFGQASFSKKITYLLILFHFDFLACLVIRLYQRRKTV